MIVFGSMLLCMATFDSSNLTYETIMILSIIIAYVQELYYKNKNIILNICTAYHEALFVIDL